MLITTYTTRLNELVPHQPLPIHHLDHSVLLLTGGLVAAGHLYRLCVWTLPCLDNVPVLRGDIREKCSQATLLSADVG